MMNRGNTHKDHLSRISHPLLESSSLVGAAHTPDPSTQRPVVEVFEVEHVTGVRTAVFP